MNQLTVKKIVFYGDETATVTLTSNISSVDVFCHLCEHKEGDKIENLLQVLDANIKAVDLCDYPAEMIEEMSKERIEKTGSFSYVGCGKVIDENEGIIEVQGFRIEVGELSCKGSVQFKIDRLDLW